MNTPRTYFTVIILSLVGIIMTTSLTLANLRFAAQSPGGNDFIPRWLGTRLYITEHQKPYSEHTTRAIQDYIYGRPAKPEEDQQLFVYPIYAMLVFSPFALVEYYPLARALWMTVLEISMLATGIISIKLMHWRVPKVVLAGVLILALTWYPSIRALINGNAAVIVAVFICISLMCIREKKDFLAGILMALAAIKPQMVFLLMFFTLLWGISHRRWQLVGSISGSLLLLTALSFLVQPDWIMQNYLQIAAYPGYTPPATPAAIFADWWPDVGKYLGWLLSLVIALLMVREWKAAMKTDFNHFLWTACFTLAATNLVGIRTGTTHYLALFPAIILILYSLSKKWGDKGIWISVIFIIILLVGFWLLFLVTIEQSPQPMQHSIMILPIPVIILGGLYGIRNYFRQPLISTK